MQDSVVATIFVATLAALYLRPFRLHDWQIAAAGGSLAWLFGPLSARDGLDVLGDSWNIIAFFLGLMLIAAGAESSGLYERTARILARRTGRAQVAVVLLAGAGITAVLSNDATPLVLTPAVFAAARATGTSPTSSAFAATFTADGMSLLLPVSNPVNLLFYEQFEMGFGDYLRDIFPAALAGAVALGIVVLLRSEREPANRSARQEPRVAAAPVALERCALALVGVLAVGYVAAGLAGVPLSLVSLAGGVAFFVLNAVFRTITPRYVRHISPGVLVFVAGLLVLVESLSATGLLDGAGELYEALAGQPALLTILGAAIAATVASNLMNNWPAALLLSAVIATADAEAQHQLVVGTLIGCTIGANFTVVGSLSTVFWLALSRVEGVVVTPAAYFRRAAWPTAAGLGAACLVAAVSLM